MFGIVKTYLGREPGACGRADTLVTRSTFDLLSDRKSGSRHGTAGPPTSAPATRTRPVRTVGLRRVTRHQPLGRCTPADLVDRREVTRRCYPCYRRDAPHLVSSRVQ